ncbi:MAG: hypothetical protein JW896_15095, partial [Deltaproteobacteria bacterium]|nr:hypothetical protein [Deltaproteobacteria bacterium]
MKERIILSVYAEIVRKISTVIWILTIALLLTNSNRANAYEIVQLTSNDCEDTDLRINDNGQAVWVQQCGDENTAEIMFFDGSSIVQLTDDEEKDSSPIINNQGRVAWLHGLEGYQPVQVYYYNGITTVDVSIGLVDNRLGNMNDLGVLSWVADDGYMGSDSVIWLYDGEERSYFTEPPENFQYRFLTINNNGQMSWLRTHNDSLDVIDLMYYNGSDIIQFAETGPINWSPCINNNGQIAWKAGESGFPYNADIFFYNGSTIVNLTNLHGILRNYYELNDLGQVVVESNSYSISDDQYYGEIFLYQGDEYTRLTDDLIDDNDPKINDLGKVVWSRDSDSDSEIMFYNGITTIQLTDNSFDDSLPVIGNDDKIAWQGFDGHDSEIFLARPVMLPIWARTYGGINEDFASEVLQIADRGYIVVGNTESFGAGANDLWAIQLDESGTVQWEKSYGGLASDNSPNIRQTSSDGGYIMAARTESFGVGLADVLVLKLDAAGDVLWEETIGGDAADGVTTIEELPSGGYILAGRTESFGGGTAGDLWVVKLNTAGDILWQKTYGTAEGGEYATSLQPTGDGGCIVAGTTYSFGAGDQDFWVLRLDADGGIVWQKTYGGDDIDVAMSIKKVGDDGFIVAGNTYSFPVSVEGYDILVLKLDSNGDVLWQKTFGTVGWDDVSGVEPSWDGGYFLIGSTGLPEPLAPRDGWVMKLSATGEILWQKKIGGSDLTTSDTLSSLHRTYDGGVVVAGSTDSFGIGSRDAWVLKLDSTGEVTNCAAMGEWSAVSSDTSVTVSPSSGVTKDTSAVMTSSSSTVENTTFVQGEGCEQDSINLLDLPKTGQTLSLYAGDDGAIQTGTSWPSPRFVDNGDGTII